MKRASIFDKTDHDVLATGDLDVLFEKQFQGHTGPWRDGLIDEEIGKGHGGTGFEIIPDERSTSIDCRKTLTNGRTRVIE